MKLIKRQKGFSLVEIILYITVAMVIMVSVFMTYQKYNEDVKAQRMVSELDAIIDAAESYTISQNNYAGVTLNLLAQSQALPPRLISNYYRNPWGGDYALSTMNSPSGNNDMLVITIANVPQQACTRVMGSMATRLYSMAINNKIVALTPAAASGAWNRNNIDFTKAGVLCQKDNTMQIKKLKEFDTMKYLNPATSELNSTQLTYVAQERARITAAMQSRENTQTGL
ncbi:TPA: prepilin-type N-terminal cleavage/methylation domain-containing protein [Escherichia coli]|nr:prepilin-type N-terminal cleavage/methylation domain-containing protein [Escherichia coli]